MRNLLLAIGTAGTLAVGASPAMALVGTQVVGPVSFSVNGKTASTTPLVFAPFNVPGGTLTSVSWTVDPGSFSGTGGLAGDTFFGNPPWTLNVTGIPTFTFDNPGTSLAISGPAGNVTTSPSSYSSSQVATVTGGTYSNVSSNPTSVPTLQSYFQGTPRITNYKVDYSYTGTSGGSFLPGPGTTPSNYATVFSGNLYLTYTYSYPAATTPAPLPLLGASAAFGFSRKLRKKVKSVA